METFKIAEAFWSSSKLTQAERDGALGEWTTVVRLSPKRTDHLDASMVFTDVRFSPSRSGH